MVATGPQRPDRGLAAATVGQLVLLLVLSVGAGLGLLGWLVGLAYAAALREILTAALRRAEVASLGPADRVTLTRAALVGGVSALVADALARPAPTTVLVTITVAALILDAVDGQVARRTATGSPLGARFDMEVDAFLILVLSVAVAGTLGGWVLAIGGMRYAYVAAGLLLPWLRGPVPPSLARKAVAAVQGIVLVVVAAGVLPRPVAVAVTGLALAALVWSFGRDVGWLYRHRVPDALTGDRPS